MGKDKELTDKVSNLYSGDEKILFGDVYLQEVNSKEITLYFNPTLENAALKTDNLTVLLDFLKTHQPVDKRGLLFNTIGEFSLHSRPNGLSLYVQDKNTWGQGEAVDVFDRRVVHRTELEEVVGTLQDRKVSSFVFGRLRERKDYENHTILRRYFLE